MISHISASIYKLFNTEMPYNPPDSLHLVLCWR